MLSLSNLCCTFNSGVRFLAAAIVIAGAAVADEKVPQVPPAETTQSNIRSKEDAALNSIADQQLLLKCREVVRTKPQDPQARTDLARILSYLKRFDEAIEESRSAVKLAPDSAQVRELLAYILLLANRIDESITESEQAVRLDPNYASAHDELATALLMLGRYAEAEKEYNEAERLDPGDHDRRYALGIVYQKVGRTAEAIDSFGKSLAIKDSLKTREARMYAAYCNGQYQLAIDDCNAILKADPNSELAYSYRVQAYCETHQIDLALKDADEILKRGYSCGGTAQCVLGRISLEREEVSDAVDHFSKAVALNPYNSYALLLRAACAVGRGNWDQGIADCSAVIAKAGELNELDTATTGRACEVYKLRSIAYLFKKDFPDFEADAAIALKLESEDADLYALRAAAEAAQGEWKSAVTDYERAIKIEPDHVLALRLFAGLLADSPEPSIRDGKRALELATRACELTHRQNLGCLCVLASAHAENGDLQKGKDLIAGVLKQIEKDHAFTEEYSLRFSDYSIQYRITISENAVAASLARHCQSLEPPSATAESQTGNVRR